MRTEFIVAIILFVIGICVIFISCILYKKDHIGGFLLTIGLIFFLLIASGTFCLSGMQNKCEEEKQSEQMRLLSETPDGYMLCNLLIKAGFLKMQDPVENVYITTKAYKACIAGGTGSLAYWVNDTVRMIDMEDVIGIQKIADNQEDHD